MKVLFIVLLILYEGENVNFKCDLQRGVSYEWLLIMEFKKIYTDDISL